MTLKTVPVLFASLAQYSTYSCEEDKEIVTGLYICLNKVTYPLEQAPLEPPLEQAHKLGYGISILKKA